MNTLSHSHVYKVIDAHTSPDHPDTVILSLMDDNDNGIDIAYNSVSLEAAQACIGQFMEIIEEKNIN